MASVTQEKPTAPKPTVPMYRLHRPSGRAVVRLSGRDYYLGVWGTPESRAEYHRVIAEWEARGRTALPREGKPAGPVQTVTHLVDRYRTWAAANYTKAGRPTSRLSVAEAATASLVVLYGASPAPLAPPQLAALQGHLVRQGLSRRTVNDYVSVIKHMYKWATREGYLAPEVWWGLAAVSGLRRGRSEARETEPRRPVPEETLEKTLKALDTGGPTGSWATIAAMVRVQKLTGCRPGELVGMRVCDLDRSGPVWRFTPATHKTEHRGKLRAVAVGPRAQDVIRPFVERAEAIGPEAPVFPAHRGGKPYSAHGYSQQIKRVCRQHGIPHWTPHQLRHNHATAVRKQFSLDAARAALGHSGATVTELYAERDFAAAASVAAEIG